jgi:hypothetical protein
MPFIELTVSGVSDLLGNVIPKSGLTIRNFSSSAYQLEVTSPIPLENTPDLVTPLEILPTE